MKRLIAPLLACSAVVPFTTAMEAQQAAAHQHHQHGPAAALPDEQGAAEFLERARSGTERFRNRGEAIRAGYRRIGPDFPGMGEHWIHLGVLMTGRVDPGRPTFLSYAELEGEPHLIGVAYAVSLASGDSAPTAPAGAHAWHDHVGSIEDEVLFTQLGSHASPDAPRMRLAMLHAWVWLENPEGAFAKENWALPFVRARLTPPANASPAAARALSLRTHAPFYESLIARIPALADPDRARITALIQQQAAEVERLMRSGTANTLTSSGLDRLAAVWHHLWHAAAENVPPDAVTALRALAGVHDPH